MVRCIDFNRKSLVSQHPCGLTSTNSAVATSFGAFPFMVWPSAGRGEVHTGIQCMIVSVRVNGVAHICLCTMLGPGAHASMPWVPSGTRFTKGFFLGTLLP